MAITGRGDDAVARPSPTLVVARHGADLAVIDASRAELDDPDQLEARYLLDALALKAAGAAVKPPPWAKPGEVAAWAPIGAAGAADSWTPPPRPSPAGAAMLEPLIHGIKTLADMAFGMNVLLGPLAVMLFLLGDRLRRPRPTLAAPFTPVVTGRWRWPTYVAGTVVAFMILNIVFGTDAANTLIDRYGTAGAATVTGSFATSIQYNRHDVIGENVLIRTADRRVVSSRFQTDDFNVTGIGDQTVYPEPGDVFTVRYLPRYPQDFVIRNDDQSPWARKLACARLAAWRGEATRRAGFAPADAKLRDELGRATATAREAGCSG